jgi:PAS domain S-box-containing protein
MLDPDGNIATWNAGAERIKGWTAAEIIGRHFSIFYTEEDLATEKPRVELEVASHVGRFEDEGWRVRKDGTRFWANVVITALYDRTQTLRGFAKVTRDFTERRASEETARRLVAETAARRAAQDAVATRDEFLSIAGHELKTPLTALLFYSESLSRSAAQLQPGDVAIRATKVVRNAERLSRLIDELLDVSRIAAGRLTLEFEEVDLAAIVRDLVARSGDAAARVGSTLRLDAPPRIVGRWDRLRLEQVADNLVANAIKYGRGLPIDVRAEADERVARLTVRDRGVGIAPQDQARIFDRFERAVSSRHYGGLGLGLWIARQVVEAHGGQIRVTSAPGEGAEFTVELPLGAPAERAA